ncbi:sigma factor-like helix-turn-helix DNA-binding protein [Micromonospora sp. WMMD1082]|uniref:sigma factor-like helix-turn-helix DNA-binding protein n=1 Tax=Micromonospora sp. WMMD1082 TaxID=3016104 RepID=UPI002415B93B|nr:sigma factor-like helix-turn-helix DNA-binding protein [Micromonospora sp. WMMD1082]MDG4795137.1 sigma factor-like helix-turn-helix DNA-binding protein [Micromonospora sp. WMMD1082]
MRLRPAAYWMLGTLSEAKDAVQETWLRLAPPTSPIRTRIRRRPPVLADSVGPALLVVLDTLTPAERLAFVLHDMFGAPFEEIGALVDRSPAAARQLASRARRRAPPLMARTWHASGRCRRVPGPPPGTATSTG